MPSFLPFDAAPNDRPRSSPNSEIRPKFLPVSDQEYDSPSMGWLRQKLIPQVELSVEKRSSENGMANSADQKSSPFITRASQRASQVREKTDSLPMCSSICVPRVLTANT